MDKTQFNDEKFKELPPIPDFNREQFEAQKDKIIDSFFFSDDVICSKHPLNELLNRSFENQMKIMEAMNSVLNTFNNISELIDKNKINESEIETEMIKAKLIANNKLEDELKAIDDCNTILPNNS